MLEQAAYCYLNMPETRLRMFGYYMRLAADRYNRSSQRRHSLRCHKMALQVYADKSWSLAEVSKYIQKWLQPSVGNDHFNLSIQFLSWTNPETMSLNIFESLLDFQIFAPLSWSVRNCMSM